MTCPVEQDFATDPIARAPANGEEHGYARGVRDERVRIRRELLGEIESGNLGESYVYIPDLLAALSRICPEEGQTK